MAQTISVTPLAGANTARRTTTQEYALGTPMLGAGNSTWVYVRASEAVTSTCTVNTTTFALTDAAGNHTADDAFASGEYGWVRRTTTPL